MRHIKTTYAIITPESAEHGDYAEHGWINQEGHCCEPDEIDQEEGLTAVDVAVKLLSSEGATEPSSYPRWSTRTSYCNAEYNTNYRTGAVEERSYHLYGFTEFEERAIYKRMTQR